MQLSKALLLLVLAGPLFGATLTTIRSGSWTDTSTATSPWCNSSGSCTAALVGSGTGGVPGTGDTVNTAFTLTCNGTCVATTINTTATAGKLVVNSPNLLTVVNVVVTGSLGVWLDCSGGTVTLNNTGGSSTITPSASFVTQELRMTNGCTLTSSPAGGSIGPGAFFYSLGRFYCRNSTMSGLGGATLASYAVGFYLGDATWDEFDVDGCNFNNPGPITFYQSAAAGATLSLKNSHEWGSLWDPFGQGAVSYTAMEWKSATGVLCTMTGNVIEDVFGQPGADWEDCTVNDNVFRKGLTITDSTGYNPITSVSRNVIDQPLGARQLSIRSDNVSNNIIWTSQPDNPHFLYPDQAPGHTSTFTDNVYGSSACYNIDAGDFLTNPATESYAAGHWVMTGTLALPNACLWETGDPLTWSGNISARSDDAAVNHTTWISSSQGLIDNEGGYGVAASVVSLKYNLLYNNGLFSSAAAYGPQFLWQACGGGAGLQNIVNAAAADYNYVNTTAITGTTCGNFANANAQYNVVGPGPVGTSTGYGFHDNTTYAPHFAGGFDAGKMSLYAFFDQIYLGASISATSWQAQASGFTFVAGNTYSFTDATYYGGKTINLYCNVTHVKTATTPMSSVGWGYYWNSPAFHWAELNQKASMASGIVDGALGCSQASPCTAVQVLTKWARRQFTPQNRAGFNVDGAGGYVGAVPFDPAYAGVVGQ